MLLYHSQHRTPLYRFFPSAQPMIGHRYLFPDQSSSPTHHSSKNTIIVYSMSIIIDLIFYLFPRLNASINNCHSFTQITDLLQHCQPIGGLQLCQQWTVSVSYIHFGHEKGPFRLGRLEIGQSMQVQCTRILWYSRINVAHII